MHGADIRNHFQYYCGCEPSRQTKPADSVRKFPRNPLGRQAHAHVAASDAPISALGGTYNASTKR